MIKHPLWLRVIVSLMIFFHLTVVIVLANGPSILGRIHQGWLLGYANQLGVNQTWNFFSPDPTQIHYIHYYVHFEDESGNSTQEPIEAYLPEEKREIVMDSSKRRMLHSIRFISLDESRTEKLLAPWLCRKYPGASFLNIKHVLEVLPGLDKAYASLNLSVEDLIQPMPYRELNFNCKSLAKVSE